MRKVNTNIDEVRGQLCQLSGILLKISVNKGRKRIVYYEGQIEGIYPSVFTLKIDGEKNIDKLAFSYSDLICGDVALEIK